MTAAGHSFETGAFSDLKLRQMGMAGGKLLLVFSDWKHMEVRTIKGDRIMEYSTEGSIDNINFVGNRYMVCDFGCDGIMSYVLKIWDFELSQWIMEDDSYSNEYIVLGYHPTAPLIAAGYTEEKHSVELINITRGTKKVLTDDDSIDLVAFDPYCSYVAGISWNRIVILNEKNRVVREIPHELGFTTEFFCWAGPRRLVTGHVDKKIRIWDVNERKAIKEFEISTYPMTGQVSHDGRWLVCSPEAEMGISTVIDLKLFSIMKLNYEKVVFFPDEKKLCCANQERIEIFEEIPF